MLDGLLRRSLIDFFNAALAAALFNRGIVLRARCEDLVQLSDKSLGTKIQYPSDFEQQLTQVELISQFVSLEARHLANKLAHCELVIDPIFLAAKTLALKLNTTSETKMILIKLLFTLPDIPIIHLHSKSQLIT